MVILGMLKKFEVENFKNFKSKIQIDFSNVGGYQFGNDCISNDLIAKMLIYGKNAVGKTNLGEAIMDVKKTLFRGVFINEEILNANSSSDYASFMYEFTFEDKKVLYKYTKYGNSEIRDEELLIDGIRIFYCGVEQNFNDFNNLYIIQAENINVEDYENSVYEEDNYDESIEHRIPFFRFLIRNAAFSKDSVIRKVASYINRMERITLGSSTRSIPSFVMEKRFMLFEDRSELDKLEGFFSNMGIECKLSFGRMPDGKSQLYFACDKSIPFYKNASSGTIALFNLYVRILASRRKASFMYIDEFDAFYHYEMARNLIHFLKEEYPECQVILTTHNTNLMSNRLLRPDCLFILSSEGKLTALCDATERELREGHNLEKMYISGEFAEYE